ncbi:MAG: nucleoside-diphosphate kinase, partial [Arsenophonus sp. ET-DL12-MAG3]
YGDDFTANAVHGSDSFISAEREIAFFFTEDEIHSR